MITKRQFENTLKKIMEHNQYADNMVTVEECDKASKWTPTDLIMREYYNNGCGSAKGFLGITPKRCMDAFEYIQEHKLELVQARYINERGVNNFGFPLWSNYDLQR